MWYSVCGKGGPGKTAKSKVAALRLKADGEFLSFMIVSEELTRFEAEGPALCVRSHRSAMTLPENDRGQCGKSLM